MDIQQDSTHIRRLRIFTPSSITSCFEKFLQAMKEDIFPVNRKWNSADAHGNMDGI